MKVTEATRRALGYRRKARDLKSKGFRPLALSASETAFGMALTYERIDEVEIMPGGNELYVRTSPRQESGG